MSTGSQTLIEKHADPEHDLETNPTEPHTLDLLTLHQLAWQLHSWPSTSFMFPYLVNKCCAAGTQRSWMRKSYSNTILHKDVDKHRSWGKVVRIID